jgi:F-type H+-transporting ATPase subunit b
MRNRQYVMLVAVVAMLVVVGTAWGAEGGDANAANDRAKDLFQWVNFAIVAGLLVWVFKGVTPKIFRKKANNISSAIKTATSAKEEAVRQLREAEAKLARLKEEVAELRAAAQRESQAEAERIRNLTMTDAERVEAAAHAEIEAAERAARLELKAIAANLAVDGAESLLAKQLTPQTQESLVAAFVKSLGGRPN